MHRLAVRFRPATCPHGVSGAHWPVPIASENPRAVARPAPGERARGGLGTHSRSVPPRPAADRVDRTPKCPGEGALPPVVRSLRRSRGTWAARVRAAGPVGQPVPPCAGTGRTPASSRATPFAHPFGRLTTSPPARTLTRITGSAPLGSARTGTARRAGRPPGTPVVGLNRSNTGESRFG